MSAKVPTSITRVDVLADQKERLRTQLEGIALPSDEYTRNILELQVEAWFVGLSLKEKMAVCMWHGLATE